MGEPDHTPNGHSGRAPDLCEGVRVKVDSSWADTLPPCCVCGRDVPWEQALLMPCSTVEDGDVDCVGIVHSVGCWS